MSADYPPDVASLRLSSRWAYRELRAAPENVLSLDELEAIMGCDRSTVNRAVNDLEQAGVAEIVCDRYDVQKHAVQLL